MTELNSSEQWLLVLRKDQWLVKELTEFAKRTGIRGGSIHGIGALKNVELGFYHLDTKSYERKTFNGEDFELISLHGNFTLRDNEPYVHVHCSLGRSDFSVIGGHLFDGQVAVTAEIAVAPFGRMPQRQLDPEVGLQLICGFAK